MAFDATGSGRTMSRPPVTAAAQLSYVCETRNRKHSALVKWLTHSTEAVDQACRTALASHFTVAELWRARIICRAFRSWATSCLESLPRVVAVGGSVLDVNAEPAPRVVATAGVEMLNFATLKWSRRPGAIPPLPDPRAFQDVTCSYEDGRVVVGGGWNVGLDPPLPYLLRSVLQWESGSTKWSVLPDFSVERRGAAGVGLPDGGLMVLGGWCADEGRASDRTLDQVLEAPQIEILLGVEIGMPTEWVAIRPNATAPPPEPEPEPASKKKQKQKVPEPAAEPEPVQHAPHAQPKKPERRRFPTAVRLRTGKILVAGGRIGASTESATSTCELWDPDFKIWTELPPMAVSRSQAAGCLLPSGCVAIVGGIGTDNIARHDGEIFDPTEEQWRPMPAAAYPRGASDVVQVPGGLIVVGCSGGEHPFVPCELYEEESDRWYELPHAMVEARVAARAVSIPADALRRRRR